MSATHPRSIDPDEDREFESAQCLGESVQRAVPPVIAGAEAWQGRESEPVLSRRDIAWGAVVAIGFTIAGCVAGALNKGA